MKKFLWLVLAVSLVLGCVACTQSEPPVLEDEGNEPAFVKPENYASVLEVTINPVFRLYLDEAGVVLAVEALNDDALGFVFDVEFSGKDYALTVEQIVRKANENGFLNTGAVVQISFLENREGELTEEVVFEKVSETVLTVATQLNLALTVEDGAERVPDEESPATPDLKEDSDTGEETSGDGVHVHRFSAATCTAAQTCSCGATFGAALGHDFKEATCQAPKTCKVCKLTEGTYGDHSYFGNQCVVCGHKKVLDPASALSSTAVYYSVNGSELVVYQFVNGRLRVCGVYSSDAQYPESENTITYEGKQYYPVGQGGPLPLYTLRDGEIVLRYAREYAQAGYDDEYHLIVTADYQLEVTSARGNLFQVGSVLKKTDCHPLDCLCGCRQGAWTATYLSVCDGNLELHSAELVFDRYGANVCNVGYGVSLSSLPEDFRQDILEGNGATWFEGVAYYIGKGMNGEFKRYNDDGNTVTIYDNAGNTVTFTRVSNGQMKVTSSSEAFDSLNKVPVGTVFTYVNP